MARKLLIIISSFLFLLGLLASRVLAQEQGEKVESSEGITAPDYILPPPEPGPGFLGQDYSYTVVFRGNGEGVVSLRVVFTNKGDESLSEISLRVPKVEPKELSVYQVIRESRCIRYGPTTYPNLQKYKNLSGSCPLYSTLASCNQAQTRGESCSWHSCVNSCLATGSPTSEVCSSKRECVEYQEPDYYSYYGASKYQKAQSEYKGDTITVTLPQPIKPSSSGSYFVYFRAFGYAKKNIFGAYKFTLETLKVEDDIRSLRVGVNTDSDLVLHGAKGEVQYRFEDVGTSTFGAAGVAAPEASPAIDRFYSSIGQGKITKTASNLAPLESYTVSGSYATNRLRLYAKEIAIGVAAALVLLALAVIVVRLILKKIGKLGESEPQAQQKAGRLPETTRLLLSSAGLGLVSSILIVGYTALVIVLGVFLSSLVSYRYEAVLILFLVFISFSVYPLLLFGPALYLGVKKGAGWGIATVAATILWLILFLGLAAIVFFLLGQGAPRPIVPLPLLEGLR